MNYSRQQSFCNQASMINKICVISGACKENKKVIILMILVNENAFQNAAVECACFAKSNTKSCSLMKEKNFGANYLNNKLRVYARKVIPSKSVRNAHIAEKTLLSAL